MYFNSENITIYNDDCLNVFKSIGSETIDCVVTDPPYKIIAGGIRVIDSNSDKKDYSKTDPKGCLSRGRIVVSDGNKLSDKWIKQNGDIPCAVKDGLMFDHNEITFSEWIPEVYRILKPGTHCYIMTNSRNLKDIQIESEKAGFVFQNLLAWNKGNKTPNKYYMQQLEFILMLSKRPARNINDMGCGNMISIPNPTNKLHPTEKPVGLMRVLIENSTNPNEIVLDPFMGAGATCLACIESGRQFIGIEIDQKYVEIAINRMANNQPLLAL